MIRAFLLWLVVTVTLVAAWATHVLACIKAQAWILLIIGIVVPPIGWLHGAAVWFGFSW